MLYDKRDVQMVANIINNLGPKNEFYRALMVAEAAHAAGISMAMLADAANYFHQRKEG